MYEEKTNGIVVRVKPTFLDDHSQPDEGHFVWSYDIEVINQGSEKVQLISRYWKITDANGGFEEITGDGVIGKQPVLYPGEDFKYQSAAPLPTASGIMAGHYVMRTEDNRLLKVQIPAFSLDSPYESRRHH